MGNSDELLAYLRLSGYDKIEVCAKVAFQSIMVWFLICLREWRNVASRSGDTCSRKSESCGPL